MDKFKRNRNREKEEKKTNDNIIIVPVTSSGYFYNDSENLYNDVLDVIEAIPFKKISIPLYVKKSILDPNNDGYTAVGYIKSYNINKGLFRIYLFSNNKENIIDLLDNEDRYFVIAPLFTHRDDSLGTITKLVLTEVEYSDDEYDEDAEYNDEEDTQQEDEIDSEEE